VTVKVHGFFGSGGSDAGADALWRFVNADTTAQPGERIYVRSDALIGEGDLNWNQVSCLLHFDGAHDSTAFVDETGKTVGVVGAARLTTALKKFGTAGGLFYRSDRITLPASADFDYGTGDLTFETFVRLGEIASGSSFSPANQYVMDLGANGLVWSISGDNGGATYLSSSGTPVISKTGIGWETGQWYHLAITRETGTMRLFIDGALVATSTYAGALGTSGAALSIGNYGGGGNYGISGVLDELRITKGHARYTEAFTPPAAPFAESAVAPATITLGAGSEGQPATIHAGPGPGVVQVDDGTGIEALATDEQRDYVHDGAGWVRL
jgi:hypothetical protein